MAALLCPSRPPSRSRPAGCRPRPEANRAGSCSRRGSPAASTGPGSTAARGDARLPARRTSPSAPTGATPTWPPTAATRSRSSLVPPGPARCVSCRDSGAASATKERALRQRPRPGPALRGRPQPRRARTSTWPRRRSGALAVFARNRQTGAIRQLAGAGGCISQRPGGRLCRRAALFKSRWRRGESRRQPVYVASRRFPSAVAVLAEETTARSPRTPARPAASAAAGLAGCVPGRALNSPEDVVVSRDSESVLRGQHAGAKAVAVLRAGPAG